jgi:rhamnose utilization protein RhaD (predicted bifunctional aldolase and dehydrogenase)
VRKHTGNQAELQLLRQLAARVGSDPLLTQASTGNCSMKLDDVLWIKASGKWMADALCDDVLIPLDLTGVVRECLLQLGRDDGKSDSSFARSEGCLY